mmetsp:Transcript_124105/g.356423  ORF Transcript_124105/g.356423 Transcript_124105/m.356423 type:complete len:206 (-) Transcript_124105:1781-2398(-)
MHVQRNPDDVAADALDDFLQLNRRAHVQQSLAQVVPERIHEQLRAVREDFVEDRVRDLGIALVQLVLQHAATRLVLCNAVHIAHKGVGSEHVLQVRNFETAAPLRSPLVAAAAGCCTASAARAAAGLGNLRVRLLAAPLALHAVGALHAVRRVPSGPSVAAVDSSELAAAAAPGGAESPLRGRRGHLGCEGGGGRRVRGVQCRLP